MVPRPMTKDALMSAFGGESMAHMRYLIFSEIAEEEGLKGVLRLFRAVAFSEYVHARNHYRVLGELKTDAKVVAGATFGPGNTSKNLELAIMGEKFEVEEMYPVYIEIAKSQDEKEAERSFTWALEVEKIHAKLYEEAKKAVEEGRDYKVDGSIWVCPMCGHTHVGRNPPERCPICGTPGSKYREF